MGPARRLSPPIGTAEQAMNLQFPAVIKDIRIGPDGILATFDISTPDISTLSDLIDQEIIVTVSTGHLDAVSCQPGSAAPQPEARLPFEPDESRLLEEPRARKRRASSGRKRPE
jgi:hypothetical protein